MRLGTGLGVQRRDRIGLLVERFPKAAGELQIVDLGAPLGRELERKGSRAAFRERFSLMLAREFPDWRLEEISSEPNLEESLSPAYVRALLRKGGAAMAVLGALGAADRTAGPTDAAEAAAAAEGAGEGEDGGVDAAEAASGMQRVATLPKPAGFAPGNNVTATTAQQPGQEQQTAEPGQANKPAPLDTGSVNSDLAFSGNHLYVGNYNGINFYDIDNPNQIKLKTSLLCPGGQGDVSVYKNLLFMSAEAMNGRLDCGTQGIPLPAGYTPPPPPPRAPAPNRRPASTVRYRARRHRPRNTRCHRSPRSSP